MITKITDFKHKVKINESMRSSTEEQLEYVDSILPILKNFYTGNTAAGLTAERLVKNAIQIFSYSEDSLAYIRIIAQIPDTLDNIAGSNSFFNLITDIDTEAHSELFEFDNVMNNISKTYNEILKK